MAQLPSKLSDWYSSKIHALGALPTEQLVPTFNVPAVTTGPATHAASTAHSVAANAANNHVFVPLGANNAYPNCLTGCIAVYGTSARMDERAER